jgi:hypothetical protein
MTAAADVELDPATVHGLVARAGDPTRERWLDQARRTGGMSSSGAVARGVVRRGDQLVHSTAREPDGALMVRCGNRREACCPSCAHEYRGDMWQLVSTPAWPAAARASPNKSRSIRRSSQP